MRASFRVRLHLCREIFDGLSTPMPIAGMARKTYGKEFYSRKIAASRMRPFTVLESAANLHVYAPSLCCAKAWRKWGLMYAVA